MQPHNKFRASMAASDFAGGPSIQVLLFLRTDSTGSQRNRKCFRKFVLRMLSVVVPCEGSVAKNVLKPLVLCVCFFPRRSVCPYVSHGLHSLPWCTQSHRSLSWAAFLFFLFQVCRCFSLLCSHDVPYRA